ncbi:probable glucan endo-1,3-beta-glucosidase BG4 [Morus notabilis]|uniref:probable glucan endo-1,3-beta-glucosidase BG4 n=1 Tax=Morus notabilis TaxID=981085 RepID=UPI000CED6088|nr:probable glucan endo-1,3-beta-glucosidase BG4 [Morus notabilis]
MINVYPYFANASDPANVRLDYAQFTARSPVVQDGNMSYYKLEWLTVRRQWWLHESGACMDIYNKNFVNHISSNTGTPKRPGGFMEGFTFAMFNENLKPDGVEQNFRLFYPNMHPVYSVL